MSIIDLSPKECAALLDQVLSRAESRHLEFKRVSGKMVNKALETICAFANTEDGILVLGLADPKEHHGKARLFGVEENPEGPMSS
jgi:ATP-dependent DNA helicase RecG